MGVTIVSVQVKVAIKLKKLKILIFVTKCMDSTLDLSLQTELKFNLLWFVVRDFRDWLWDTLGLRWLWGCQGRNKMKRKKNIYILSMHDTYTIKKNKM